MKPKVNWSSKTVALYVLIQPIAVAQDVSTGAEQEFALEDAADALAAGDINGDGYADVVAPHYGSFDVYYGSSTILSSTVGTTVALDGCTTSSGMPLGDVHGDGFDDIGCLDWRWRDDGAFVADLWIYPGESGGLDGTPQGPVEEVLVYEGGGEAEGLYFSNAPSAFPAGDLDGDGAGDLVFAQHLTLGGEFTTGEVCLIGWRVGLTSSGGGTGSAATYSGDDGYNGTCAATGGGDVTRDGYDDIVFAYDESLALLYGSSGSIGDGETYSAPWADQSVHLELIEDFDGGSDLVALYDSSPWAYIGSADGLSSDLADDPWYADGEDLTLFVENVGDWNADGAPDLALSLSDGTAHLHMSSNSEESETTALSSTGYQEASDVVHLRPAGDVNNDGYADLLASNTDDDTLMVFYGGAVSDPSKDETCGGCSSTGRGQTGALAVLGLLAVVARRRR